MLAVGEAVYVGTGGRTNRAGARALRDLLAPLGARVIEVPVAGVLHLKSAVTALPDGTIVGHPPRVPGADLFPGPPGGAGGRRARRSSILDERRVLVAADCPRSAELFAARGFEPLTVEIGEFQKLEGCVTCLSVLNV